MSNTDKRDWQDCGGNVWRFPVPGGWLYSDNTDQRVGCPMVFVPFTHADAIARERARCKALVLDIYDGAPDAGTVPMSEIARIAREIEGGEA